MGFLFFIFTLILILFVNLSINKKNVIIESFIKSIIQYSLFIVISTEVLSKFNLINFEILLSLYLIFWCSSIFYLVKNEFSVLPILKKIKTLISNNKLLFSASLLIISIVFIQGIVYPPNNWDSLTYHLPRVLNWIQHNNLENFPTNITRQIYSPPLSEYFILHSILLSGNDFYVNSIQLFFLVFTAIIVHKTVSILTKDKVNLFQTIIICITLPEAILQASSTQNDIIHSFYLISSLYFGIKLYKELNLKNSVYFGSSLGLCLLSKIIAYLYLPALILLISILIINKNKQKINKLIQCVLVTLTMIIAINFPFSLRKIEFTDNISGTNKGTDKGIVFEKYSTITLFSTMVKNTALHFDPFFVGDFGNKFAEKIHKIIGIDINEKGTNVFDFEFNSNPFWKNHEDTQPNFIHLLLFCISISLSFIDIKNRRLFNLRNALLILILVQFSLFCSYIRWEPWNSRVHTPLFYEMIIYISIVFTNTNIVLMKKLFNLFLFICFIYSFYVSIFNYSRPILTLKKTTSEISIFDHRYKKYFANNPDIYFEYLQIKRKLSKIKSIENIGIMTHIDGWEYPIMNIVYTKPNLKFNDIFVNNSSRKYLKKIDNKYIISTYINEKLIKSNNSIYKNISNNNNYLYIYEKI